MSTRNIAGRFVVVISGVAAAASALAQVPPESTYPAPAPAATGTYDPAQPGVPATTAPVPSDPAAQMPGQTPMPADAMPNGAMPGAMPNGMAPPIYQVPAPSRVRNAFAATLGAILQNAASAGSLGLSQLVTGSITAWFSRRQNRLAGQPYGMPAGTPGYPQGYPTTDPYATAGGQPTYQPGYPTQTTAQAYPGQTYPQSAYPTTPGQPGYSPQGTYPATQPYGTPGTYPATPDANGMYTATSAYAPTTYYDPQTGQPTQAMAYPTANVTSTSDVYAGIAYEVHAVRPAVGDAVPVNPATYEFRTGDRFLVHYRPSMPGRMEVYNVNPLGQITRIDSVNMAAGQLSTLGPYEFAANRGDESLRLVLSPCTTPQLLTATRDIINVSMSSQPAAPSMQGGLQLGSCSGLATRGVAQAGKAGGVRTRDIRNVALDGGTSFALDPVSRQELSSGNLAPREVTIVFHHR